MTDHTKDLSIPLTDPAAYQEVIASAADAPATTVEPSVPTLDEATKTREDELAALPVPPGASALVHSATDREPVRPYTEKLPNGTVIVHN
jgi:hypothetical protein